MIKIMRDNELSDVTYQKAPPPTIELNKSKVDSLIVNWPLHILMQPLFQPRHPLLQLTGLPPSIAALLGTNNKHLFGGKNTTIFINVGVMQWQRQRQRQRERGVGGVVGAGAPSDYKS